jgi:hypothetical protein
MTVASTDAVEWLGDAASILRAKNVQTTASLLVHPSSAVSFGLFLHGAVRELNFDVIAPESKKVVLRVRIVDYWLDKQRSSDGL